MCRKMFAKIVPRKVEGNGIVALKENDKSYPDIDTKISSARKATYMLFGASSSLCNFTFHI